MIRVFTAFTGVGSQEMALRNIGVDYEVVGISEVDRYALIGYKSIHIKKSIYQYPEKNKMIEEFKRCNIAYNFSTGKSEMPKNINDIKKLYDAHILTNNFGDITKIKESELPDFDLFTYSFPCKNISVAGNQAGLNKDSGTQSSLLWECERIIKNKKPKYLLMENVKNLVGEGHIDNFKEWIEVLEKMGYSSSYRVMNGSDFGVPQNRERVMMFSIKDTSKVLKMPIGYKLEKCLHDVLEENVDDKYFMKPERYSHIDFNLPNQQKAYCIDAHYHKGISVDNFIKKKKRTLVQIGLIDNKNYNSKRIYDPIGISPTLNSMNGGNRQPKIKDNVKIRKLTPLECWRLMGYFDSDFYKAKKAGLSNTKLYERAGRGIVVPMLEEIFKSAFISKDYEKNYIQQELF